MTTLGWRWRLGLVGLGCVYCGRPDECADHIRPRSRGGLDVPENLVPACEYCNSSKGNRLITEWDPAKVLRAVAVEPKVYAELLRIRAENVEQLAERALARAAAGAVATAEARADVLGTRRLVGLAEAVAVGIVECSLDVIRKARQRDPMFPGPRGSAGTGRCAELLYDPAELQAWEQHRPGATRAVLAITAEPRPGLTSPQPGARLGELRRAAR
jgi:hypothetical protein